MSPQVSKAQVEASLGRVANALYEGVTSGYADADLRLRSYPNRSDYPALAAMLARAGMRNYWKAKGVGPGWHVTGNPSRMSETLLANGAEGLELRLLKESPRLNPGGVPHAGRNPSRQGKWIADPLSLEFCATTQGTDGPVRLLLLWSLRESNGAQVVAVRVVHTLGAGCFGSRVPVDMSYDIEPGGFLTDRLQFPGDPQSEDFFPDIDESENGGVGA